MTVLIICMGEGKGTWSDVAKVVAHMDWENIYVVTQEFFKDKIKLEKKFELIVLDNNKPIEQLIDQLKTFFDGKLFGDVCVNIISGTGKEHMALISSLLKVGAGIRLLGVTGDGVKEL